MDFKRGALIFCIFILLAVSVSAVDFDAKLETVNNRITVDELAEFKLTVTNNEPTEEGFRIKLPISDYLKWVLVIDPAQAASIGPNSEQVFNIKVKPVKSRVPPTGSLFIHFDVVADTGGEKITKQATISLVTGDEAERTYVPTVTIDADFPEKIIPAERLIFRIDLKNRNPLDIKDAKLRISSELYNGEFLVNISPSSETIVEEKNYKLDNKQRPLKDTLMISLDYKGKTIVSKAIPYEVVSYQEIDKKVDERKGFLSSKRTIIFTNKGNVPFTGKLKVETSSLKKFFGGTDPKTDVEKEGSQLYYVWDKTLTPYESFQVRVGENYLGVFIIIIVIILAAVLFYVKRSAIVLQKSVTETETKDGTLSKVKVLINVKNRTGKKIKNVSVVDKVPKLLELGKHTHIGSLKPTKIMRNSKQETLIMWNVEELTAGEERVISYYLKSNLEILGGLTLQQAVGKFHVDDKEQKTMSNRVFVKV